MRYPRRRTTTRGAAIAVTTLLTLLSSVAGLRSGAAEPSSLQARIEAPCPLDADDPGVPIVPLTAATLDSTARLRSEYNERQLARIDSLFRAGAYGDVGSTKAKDAANLVARLATVNAYYDLARLAEDSTRVWETNEVEMHDVLARYADVSFVCGARLARARFGLGHACVRYDLETPGHGTLIQGGVPMEWEVKTAEIERQKMRVIDLKLPTTTDDVVEVLVASHFTFDVEHHVSKGASDPGVVYIVDRLRGAWLRRLGTHRPVAYMYWASFIDSNLVTVPSAPMVGVRVYIPHLRLRLPLLLPDIDFDDLRNVELPQPILDMSYLKKDEYPPWLDVNEQAIINWNNVGPVPGELRERFPNY